MVGGFVVEYFVFGVVGLGGGVCEMGLGLFGVVGCGVGVGVMFVGFYFMGWLCVEGIGWIVV